MTTVPLAPLRNALQPGVRGATDVEDGATVTASILVVSYNTREMTLACIRSIFQETQGYSFEVTVIDNGSDDGSPDAIEREFPDVQLIRSRENLGFGRATDLAARRTSGTYILLLNSDVLVVDHAVDRLIEFAATQSQAGIWGGRTVFADGCLNPKSCWRFASLSSLLCQALGLSAAFRESALFNSEGYGGWNRDSVREVDFVAGCFLLITRELWHELDGFDEQFFMYSEEADLCYRARQLGARPLFTPEATIVHYGGASEPVRGPKIEKLFAGKVTFLKKHWSRPMQACGVFLLKLHTLIRVAGYSALAVVSGLEEHKRSAGEWRDVWRGRCRWSGGYARFEIDLNARGSTRG